MGVVPAHRECPRSVLMHAPDVVHTQGVAWLQNPSPILDRYERYLVLNLPYGRGTSTAIHATDIMVHCFCPGTHFSLRSTKP